MIFTKRVLPALLLTILTTGAFSAVSVGADTTEDTSEDVLALVSTEGLISLDTPELQMAYVHASDYVHESRLAWEAQFEQKYWTQRSEELAERYEAAQYDLDMKTQKAQEAESAYQESKNQLAAWAREEVQQGTGFQMPLGMEAFMGGTESMREIEDEHMARQVVAQAKANDFAQAEADKEASQQALLAVRDQNLLLQDMSKESTNLSSQSESASVESETALAEADDAWSETWRTLNTTDSTLGPQLIQRAIVEEWNTYLNEIKFLDVDIPTAEELSSTVTYPEGFTPVETMYVTDSVGIAKYDDTVVPSQEAIIRTTKALEQLGTPYAPLGDGSESWGCVPFVQDAVGMTAGFNDLYEDSGRQNRSIFDTQTGDVVFMSDPNAGIHQAGIFVFGGFYVAASAPAGEVTVDSVSVDALASVRPDVEVLNNSPAPESSEDSLDWQCGGIEGDITESAETWTLPLQGEYEQGAEFGEINTERFGEDPFQGTEFITEKEQTVHSIFRGTVTKIEDSEKWGTTVTVEHSESLESRYALLGGVTVTEGQEIASGAILGSTGATGSAAVEEYAVILFMKNSNDYSDPVDALLGPLQGNYKNGQIPSSALCPISTGGKLRCDAARAFEVLAEAYLEDMGKPIVVTDTYRSLAGQIQCTATKGNMCAVPGTSNHGWGQAIDFGGGINSFGTAEHEWMKENATKYGWYHPGWAQTDGSKPEPWHWEYDTHY